MRFGSKKSYCIHFWLLVEKPYFKKRNEKKGKKKMKERMKERQKKKEREEKKAKKKRKKERLAVPDPKPTQTSLPCPHEVSEVK